MLAEFQPSFLVVRLRPCQDPCTIKEVTVSAQSRLPADVIKAAEQPDIPDIQTVIRIQEAIQSALDDGAHVSNKRAGWRRQLADLTDGLGCFNHLYRVITSEILQTYRTGATFKDPRFLQELDIQFAKRYFRAIASYGRGDCSSRAWQVLIDRRAERSVTPLQFAVAGVNTHVGLDLAFALVETWEIVGQGDPVKQKHDYDYVNEVFFRKIPRLRSYFENSWEKERDRGLLKRVTNHICDATVVADRALAWAEAEHFRSVRARRSTDPDERRLDASVAVGNHFLLASIPSWHLDLGQGEAAQITAAAAAAQ
jgi:Family of unknown function (DUF5995)